MSALAVITCFNASGYVISINQRSLPDFLDWKSLEEKKVYIDHIGGLDENAVQMLISSQGQTRLVAVSDEAKKPLDAQSFIERTKGVEDHVRQECERLGIDRTRKPRNQ